MGFLAATDSFQNKNIDNTFQAQQAQTANSSYGNAIAAGQAQQAQGNQNAQAGVQGLQGVGAQQQSFANSLQQQAAGQGGPTMADTELTTATNQNNANAAGLAASSKGLNPAMAARTAMNAAAGNNQTAANQAAQTKVQEQLNAQAQLGGALQGAAGTQGAVAAAGNQQNAGGTSALGTAAGAQNTQNANDIQNSLGAQGLNEKAALANQSADLGVQAANYDESEQNTKAQNAMTGSVMNAVGGAASMFAKGGEVPSMASAKPVGLPKAPSGMAAPHRSFAAQVAHHLSREFFADGGDVPTDKPKTEDEKRETDAQNAAASMSEMEVDAHKPKSRQGVDLTDTKNVHPYEQKYAEGGEVDDDEDDEPDTDQAVGGEEEENYATGGDVTAGEGDGPDGEIKNADADDAPLTRALNQYTPKKGQFGSSGAIPKLGVGLYNLGQKLFGPKTETAAGYKADATKALNSGDAGTGETPIPPPATMPQGSVHPELADGSGPATPPMDPQVVAQQASQNFPSPGQSDQEQAMNQGGDVSDESDLDFKAGGPVPGQAQVPGNSLKNDVVDAKLSPGEVVLPRTISHNPKQAKKFVEHLMGSAQGSGPAALKDIKKRKVA